MSSPELLKKFKLENLDLRAMSIHFFLGKVHDNESCSCEFHLWMVHENAENQYFSFLHYHAPFSKKLNAFIMILEKKKHFYLEVLFDTVWG